ncbi:hypothetical protein CYMTET_2635 [Cymbomonas tetramitiformis]|uniref:Uncharacterized protein n=1 Tax=Cymbomonas tetramitiformis TaxID=36881 RepID=A0AAE0LLK4_9CHLO|nr:hypothetical protein CYMTET_2635 [Cymbomonas tetramitiformis]
MVEWHVALISFLTHAMFACMVLVPALVAPVIKKSEDTRIAPRVVFLTETPAQNHLEPIRNTIVAPTLAPSVNATVTQSPTESARSTPAPVTAAPTNSTFGPTARAPVTSSPVTSSPLTVAPSTAQPTTALVERFIDFDTVTQPTTVHLNSSDAVAVIRTSDNRTLHTLLELENAWAYDNCAYAEDDGNLTAPRSNAYNVRIGPPEDGGAHRYVMDALHEDCTHGVGECSACRKLKLSWFSEGDEIEEVHHYCNDTVALHRVPADRPGITRMSWFASLCVNLTLWTRNVTSTDPGVACGHGTGNRLRVGSTGWQVHDTLARNSDGNSSAPHTLCYQCANVSDMNCGTQPVLVLKY